MELIVLDKLEQRLIQLETKFEERWEAHDKRGDELKDDIDKKFITLFKYLGPVKGNSVQIKLQWALIILIITGLVGMAFKLFGGN